jgi:hypothetical protein
VFRNQRNEIVIEAYVTGIIPNLPERAVMEGGWPSPFKHLNSRGAPLLSRFLRQGGDFDFLSHHDSHLFSLPCCPTHFRAVAR